MKLTEMQGTSSSIEMCFTEMFEQFQFEAFQRQVIHAPWGFCTYGIHEGYLYIASVYIDPRHRGIGIPRVLLRELEKIGKSVGRDNIGTKVHTLDKAWQNNIAICEHLGFRRVKVSPEYIFLMKRREE